MTKCKWCGRTSEVVDMGNCPFCETDALEKAIAQERARLREEVVKLPTYIINESWARNINEVVALRDVLALLRDET